MNKTLLTIELEQGESNGFMIAEWYINDRLIKTTPEEKVKDAVIQLELQLPCTVTVVLSGKNSITDVKLEHDKIVADKYVYIKSMSLGNYPINIGVLYNKLCNFTATGKSTEKTTYFYDNGVASFDFKEKDALLWHLKHNEFLTVEQKY
jgi:hypothetical protein